MNLRRTAVGVVTGGTLVASALVGASGASAATVVPPGGVDPSLTVVNLLNINDFHGRIDDNNTGSRGLNFACTLETTKSALGEDSTLFVSAGDNIGASPFTSSSQQDNPTIDYLSTLGLFASAVGNHEFDKGWNDLTDRVVPRATWTYLGANVYERGTTTPALPEYRMTTVNGLRVAVVGAVTEETPTLVSPTAVAGLDFGDPVEAVNRVADRLSDGDDANGEADIVIAEYHEGAPEGNAEGASLEEEIALGGAFADIVTKTNANVDAIFTGHTHKEYTWDGPIPGGTGTRPVVQSASYAAFIGHVALGYDPATKSVTQYSVRNIAPSAPTAACDADPQYVAARSIVQNAVAQAVVVGSQVIGTISSDITTAYIDGKRDDRLRESSLGNLVAQVWMESLNAPGRSGADIGIMNPGGLRADLLYAPSGAEAPGEVTFAEAAAVNPFANTLQTKVLTGAQFKTLLEQQWQPAGTSRPFLKLGLSRNVTYTYDPYRAAGDRITSIMVNGTAIKMGKTYRVASSSFLVAGGDNFTVMQEGTDLKDSGLIDTDAFMNYIAANSPVAPSFRKHAVAVIPTPTSVTYGETTSFTMQGFDLTSLGAPTNTWARVLLGGKEIRKVSIQPTFFADPWPTRNGEATVSFTLTGKILPPDSRKVVYLKVIARPSGTTVTIPLLVKGKPGTPPL